MLLQSLNIYLTHLISGRMWCGLKPVDTLFVSPHKQIGENNSIKLPSFFLVVNMSLPVHLTAKDAERYPEMMKLLTALSQHLNKDGVSVQMDADKQQVNDDHKGGRFFGGWGGKGMKGGGYLKLMKLLVA